LKSWKRGGWTSPRDQAAALHPDVIVADISMPQLNGIEAARQIKKADKNTKIVFLTMHPDATYAANAFEVGASGFVLKQLGSIRIDHSHP